MADMFQIRQESRIMHFGLPPTSQSRQRSVVWDRTPPAVTVHREQNKSVFNVQGEICRRSGYNLMEEKFIVRGKKLPRTCCERP